MNIINYIPQRFVVWGIGCVGKAFVNSLDKNKIVAIIDSDPKLEKTFYNNIPIITLSEYMEEYLQYFIIVTPVMFLEIENILKKNKIINYFILSDCPVSCIPFDKIDETEFYLPDMNVEKNAIYGCTLYSLAVFYCWQNKNIKNVKIIDDVECFAPLTDEIIVAFNLSDNIISANKIDSDYIIYSTVYDSSKISQIFGQEVVDLFALEMQIEQRENLDIVKFKDSHKGKRCFIVATGPSLLMKDINRLHDNNEISFSMNNIFPAIENTRWLPNYYCIADRELIIKWEDLIKESNIYVKFVSRYCKQFWCDYTDENTYKINASFEKFRGEGFENIKFSNDISKIVYLEYTVTYLSIQIAAYMGFKEIYLLGVDFNYPKDAEINSLHYSKDYYKNDSSVYKMNNKANVAGMLKSYKKAKEVADELSIKIYNATRGGCLEVFERVDFDSLFEDKQ